MAVTITDQQRDCVLCTLTATITSDTSATTTNTIVGQIVQIVFSRTTGSDTCTVTLSDETNGMQLYTNSSVADTDITPDNVNAGGGAYCRGTMKIEASSTDSSEWTMVVYYIKM